MFFNGYEAIMSIYYSLASIALLVFMSSQPRFIAIYEWYAQDGFIKRDLSIAY